MLRKDTSKQISGFDQYYYDNVIPQDHLLRRIDETIDFSFIREMLADRYAKDRGRPAEEPEFMFKICLLEYLYNLSDVQVIEHIRLNIAYRWFLGLNLDDGLPDDSTISYFRVNRVGLEKFEEIFHRLVDLCVEAGLIESQPKRAIADATHIIADVAIPTWLTLVRQAFEKVMLELKEVDLPKAKDFQQRYEKLWEELKGKKRDEKLPFVLELAIELLEVAQPLLPKDEDPYSATAMLQKVISDRNDTAKDRMISVVDPEARTGHKSDMRTIQGYKDHIMIDEKSEIITAVKVTPANAEDGDQLIDLMVQFQEHHGVFPTEVAADKGYWFGKNLRYLHENNIIGHISWMKTKQHVSGLLSPEDFQFDPEKMEVTCPNGVTTDKYRDRTKDRKGHEFRFTKLQCQGCPLRTQCTNSKTVRNVFISEYYFDLKRGREHYHTNEYREAGKKRWLIERKHADKVRNHGLRRSRYRGLERTGIHSLLSSMASNIKRMSKLIYEKRQRDQSALLQTT
ncbi:IS1182 family transposase [Peribacillus sp. V2I11]|uniref:IS1182 family transposase n=1 Tax=Peribacillus sp. V2I11 TaxID=3042277 RepID=UPI00277DB84A|nr:IS1182 family transposase [Peribacillus sp. V2I11]MDQ0879190.1 transposase [Peribacillus sp. V2I11]MDQ0879251.1 transposase [Peribacillus sp. V2I11]